MSLYIFAIGGSGSRILRSLTMLLASGVKTKSNIIPIIIDPDASNGDLERTSPILTKYEDIRNSLKFDETFKNNFFRTSISSLNNDRNYLLPLAGTSGISYEKYLGLESMSKENQAITRMLFSDDNLNSSMDVGFKGNPNIGSVVLNQFTKSDEFVNFENNFTNGDKVFIISSIFGGTGASGFPLLLKTLRTSNNTALSSAPIGAVSLLPYFNLQSNENSTIEADSFISKSKAALNYYDRNVTGNGTLTDMYYLGDDFTGHSYQNCEGGSGQANDAHFIELLGALSIIDFDIHRTSNNTATTFHEFSLEQSPEGSIVFSDMGPDTRDILLKPLSMMALLNSYLNNRDISHRISQRWAIERKGILGRSFFNSQFFRDYTMFQKMFEDWLNELKGNQISFAPFNEDKEIVSDGLDKIKGIKPSNYKFKLLGGKRGYDLIDEHLCKDLKSVPQNTDAATTFMELFYNTLSSICSKHLNIN